MVVIAHDADGVRPNAMLLGGPPKTVNEHPVERGVWTEQEVAAQTPSCNEVVVPSSTHRESVINRLSVRAWGVNGSSSMQSVSGSQVAPARQTTLLR